MAPLVAGSALLALYALAGWWPLGFVALLPWLLWLNRLGHRKGLLAPLLAGWLLSVLFTGALFAWFGLAIGRYTQTGGAVGVFTLLLLAPFFQPQVLAWVLVRGWVRQRVGPAAGAMAGALVWVAVEWAVPKLLGDTFGHGLYPSEWLRQGAQLGGAALLTLALLLVNEAMAARRWKPALLALLAPLLLAGFGMHATRSAQALDAPLLRVGLVQANITDIEARRRAQGSGAVLRELLDVHLAMSFDAVERQGADVLLWSETVYPTTFGQPKSAAGAELDAELLATIAASGRPFVFGTYDRDTDGENAGEYNAAAFVDPQRGLTGFYRKTRLFPLTETVPAWLDGPVLRRVLPWVGDWRPGSGARPMPLRLKDGRELAVQVLICRDAVDPQLALDAARLGAQVLFTMSNDSWFDEQPVGARLHQAVAAFRSIETGLPQFRVTTSGYSSVIDAQGRVRATSAMGERALVVGSLPVGAGGSTPMLRLGDWVGPTALALLLLGGVIRVMPRRAWQPPALRQPLLPNQLVLLPQPLRVITALLRLGARLALVGLGLAWLLSESLRAQQLLPLRWFVAAVLLPEAIAACLLAAYRVRVSLRDGVLSLSRSAQRLSWPVADIVGMTAWRLPLPSAGATLRLRDGQRLHLAGVEPMALSNALQAAGRPPDSGLTDYQRARGLQAASVWRSPWLKFGLLPLLLALPAFHLHQHIAYGGLFGELQTHGLRAWGSALAIWWASWGLAVALCAAVLRSAVEAGSWLAAQCQPARATLCRVWLERLALLGLYLGLPGWLALRLLSS